MTMSLPGSKPDFVLQVEYARENGKPTREADLDFKRLVETLHKSGFSTSVRAGTADDILVFIKLGEKYGELTEREVVKNYQYGVTSKNETLADRARIIYEYLASSADGLGITPLEGDWSFVKAIVPLHTQVDAVPLSAKIKGVYTPSKFTTTTIRNNYGASVALYFEFVKYYISWLVLLAILGVVSYYKAKKTYSLTYSFVNLIWGTLFITSWNKRSKYLVNFWGVQNSTLVEQHNYKLKQAQNPTPSPSSSGIRFAKQLAFVPVALGFTAVLVGYQLACFFIEIFLTDLYAGPGKSLLTLLPTILIVGFVPILTIVYKFFSDLFIKWEAHDNAFTKTDSQVIKTFVLNFLTGYVPLIITSFLYLPFAHLVQPHLGDIKQQIASRFSENRFYYKYLIQLKKSEEFKINQERLDNQFFYFVVTNQVIGLFVKFVVPLVISHGIKLVKKYTNKAPAEPTEDDPAEHDWLQNVRASLALPEYSVVEDYRAVVLQYGYLILFGPVWPLAPLVSIVFNWINIKLDVFKLDSGLYFRPSVHPRADSIHPWDWALFALTWIGSVVSPLVTAFYRHGTAPPKHFGEFNSKFASTNVSSAAQLIAILVVSENGFLVLYFVLQKLFNLLKSEPEAHNDFSENDLKLRGEFYAGKVVPVRHLNSVDGGVWSNSSAKDTIKQARQIPEQSHEEESEVIPQSNGYSTSTDDASKRALAEKQRQLEEKQAELEAIDKQNREKLKQISEPGDRIIETKDGQGHSRFSTIDSNEHIPVENPERATSQDLKSDAKHISDEFTKDAHELGKEFTENAQEAATDFKKDVRNTEEKMKNDEKKFAKETQKASKDTKKDVKQYLDDSADNSSVSNSVGSKAGRKSTIKRLFKGKKE